MEIDQDKGSLLEQTLVLGPGRVKQGLIWLQSDKAKELGLSLEQLVVSVVHNERHSQYFDLSAADTCAIGFAGDWTSYGVVKGQMGEAWLREHGFLIPGLVEDYFCQRRDIHSAYGALTEEWRTQLQALADEQDRA